MLTHWKTRLPLFPVWPETANLEGILVPIRDSPFPPGLRRHILRGGYEMAERTLVQEFVRPGDQVLEIGASSGILSSFLWREVGESGRVVSVEGNPTLRKWFQKQQGLNGFTGRRNHKIFPLSLFIIHNTVDRNSSAIFIYNARSVIKSLR